MLHSYQLSEVFTITPGTMDSNHGA